MSFFPGSDAVLTAALSIFLFLALCAALVLIVVSLRRPSTLPLAVAAGLVTVSLVVVAISPVNVPLLFGLVVALLAVVVAVLGGNPVTRRILEIATSGDVRETEGGGILVRVPGSNPEEPERPMMRGGTMIGYLERLAVAISLLAGYPAAIAVVVAIKGIGRFSELASPEARERFIVGTLASLLWACAVGALLRLAIW